MSSSNIRSVVGISLEFINKGDVKMKKKLVAGLVSGLFLTSCMVCMAETLIIKASSSNDAQYVSSSTGSPTVDETSHFDAGGSAIPG